MRKPIRVTLVYQMFFVICIVSVAFLLSMLGCSKDKNITGPGDTDDTTVKVLDTKQQTIETGGGTVSLTDGASVVFPSGALTSSAAVTVREIDPTSWFEQDSFLGREVISCEGISGTLSKSALLRVPLPLSMTVADSLSVSSGLIDENTGTVYREPCTIEMIDGKPFAVVSVTHFSSRLFEWIVGTPPPRSYNDLAVPYYNQGSSQYCWATSVQMLTEAVRHNDDSEITEIIGAMNVDEGGITAISFRFSGTLASLVKTRTGVTPDRGTWDYVNINQMKNHLKREIGVRHHPVALFNGVWSHAVVVVGYDDDTFFIQDPASTNPAAIGYTARTWDEIAGKMDALTNMVTLSVPSAVAENSVLVRANILPQSLGFVKPSTGQDDPSAVYSYGWDYTVKEGYSFRHATKSTLMDVLPGTVTTLRETGDIEISNASRTAAQSVIASIDITSLGPLGTHYYESKTITAAPNSVSRFTINDIPVDAFRENRSSATEYLLTVRASSNGTVQDAVSLNFTIGSVTPELESVSPSSAPVGAVVTLTGKRFGALKTNNTITFNGVEADSIVSWNDSEIKVSVPAAAQTGPVVVKRGAVASDDIQFTVSKKATELSGTLSFTDPDGFSSTGTWKLTGASIKSWYSNDPQTQPILSAKKGETAILTITAKTPKALEVVRNDFTPADSTYSITTTRRKLMGFDNPDSPILYKQGTFPISTSASETELTAQFTFNGDDDDFTLSVVYEVRRDIEQWSLKAQDDGALVYSSIDKYIKRWFVFSIYVKEWSVQ